MMSRLWQLGWLTVAALALLAKPAPAFAASPASDFVVAAQAEGTRAESWQRRSGAEQWEPARLKRAIEETYRVVPLRDGIALVPRRASRDVQSIELSGDAIAINGTPVTGSELRERLGADSEKILALSYLAPAERRALFQGNQRPREPAPSTAPAEPTTPPEPTPPAAATARESADVERTRHSDTRVHIGGSVDVGEDESVDGPVVAVGGSATVNGEVREDVVAVLGNVRLGPKAHVHGDVTAVGGTIDRDPHAAVDGRTNQIGIGFPRFHIGRRVFFWPSRGWFVGTFGPQVELTASLSRMILFGLLASLLFLIAGTSVSRIEHTLAVEPWKAALVGVLTQVFIVPVLVLTVIILLISVVGIPLLLALPFVVLAFVVALILGFAGTAYRVGRWFEQRFGLRQASFVLMLVGLLAIWALTLAGRLIAFAGWPVWFLSSSLLAAGFFVEYVAWTMGLGAAVITRFGTRPAGGGPPPLVASAPAEPEAGKLG